MEKIKEKEILSYKREYTYFSFTMDDSETLNFKEINNKHVSLNECFITDTIITDDILSLFFLLGENNGSLKDIKANIFNNKVSINIYKTTPTGKKAQKYFTIPIISSEYITLEELKKVEYYNSLTYKDKLNKKNYLILYTYDLNLIELLSNYLDKDTDIFVDIVIDNNVLYSYYLTFKKDKDKIK